MIEEDRVMAKLRGIPLFCLGRFYSANPTVITSMQYRFNFDNGYGASIIILQSHKDYPHGKDTYELAVLHENNITYDTDITADVLRGDEVYMHELLNEIEKL